MSNKEDLLKSIRNILDIKDGNSSVVEDMEDGTIEVVIMENKESKKDFGNVKEDPLLTVIKETIDNDETTSRDKQSAIKILKVLTGETGSSAANHLKSKIKATDFNFGRIRMNPYLSFAFRKGDDGINAVKIIYNKQDDDYSIEFSKSDGLNTKHETDLHVTADKVKSTFVQRTGHSLD